MTPSAVLLKDTLAFIWQLCLMYGVLNFSVGLLSSLCGIAGVSENWHQYSCKGNQANKCDFAILGHFPFHAGNKNRYTIPVSHIFRLPAAENCRE